MRVWYLFLGLILIITSSNLNLSAEDDISTDRPSHRITQLGDGVITGNIAFSADGTKFAVPTSIGVRIYDVKSDKTLAFIQLIRMIGYLSDIVFSPDGNTIATNQGELWDVHTGKFNFQLKGHSHSVSSVDFSPDGKTITSGSYDNTLIIWDSDTGQLIQQLKGHTDAVTSVKYSPDGKTLVSTGEDRNIRLWDFETGGELGLLPNSTYKSIHFSPDGNTIATNNWGSVELWDIHKEIKIRTYNIENLNVLSLSYSPDGNIIAIGNSDYTVNLLNTHTGEIQTTFGNENVEMATSGGYGNDWFVPDDGGGKQQVFSVGYSPDGSIIATASSENTIQLWDAHTHDLLTTHTLSGHIDYVSSVMYSPDGKTIVSGSVDNSVRLWDVNTHQEIMVLKEHTDLVSSVAYSPDGNRIASGSSDGIVLLWDVQTGESVGMLDDHKSYVTSLAYSPDGKLIVTGCGDGSVRIWDSNTYRLIGILKGHYGGVNCVAFSPDGKTIASGSWDSTVRLWSVDVKEHIITLSGHTHCIIAVTYSSDGRLIATGGVDGSVRLWNSKTGRFVKTYEERYMGDIYSIQFSLNDSTILVGTWGLTYIWNISTGEKIDQLNGGAFLALSPDGRTLGMGSFDSSISLWELGYTNSK
ncbi:hypothetical protein C6497_01495 [Candidatus Poribacteria bacterium]|nr:MAG: hypothetical protein C6497_01495 [Candidatus Poribacteria bacterium]